MKRGPGVGRIYKLNSSYPNVKFEVSTVNMKPLKTLTLETRFWYEKSNEKNSKLELETLFRNCKRFLHHKSDGIFDQDKIIHIKDIPADLEAKTQKVFTLFEHTLFPKIQFNTDMEITMVMTQLTQELYDEVFAGRADITKSKR